MKEEEKPKPKSDLDENKDKEDPSTTIIKPARYFDGNLATGVKGAENRPTGCSS